MGAGEWGIARKRGRLGAEAPAWEWGIARKRGRLGAEAPAWEWGMGGLGPPTLFRRRVTEGS